MSILNITPCTGILKKGQGQIVGDLHTDAAINVSSDSTGTAMPKLRGGVNNAEYYMLQTDGAMYIRLDDDATKAGQVAVGNTLLQSGQTLFITRQGARDFIGKLDKA